MFDKIFNQIKEYVRKNLKNKLFKLALALVCILIYYLVGKYAHIQTGIENVYIFLQYPILCFVAILISPHVAGFVGFFGHLFLDIGIINEIHVNYIAASACFGLFVGHVSRFAVEHTNIRVRTLFEPTNDDIDSRKQLFKARAIILIGILVSSFICFFLIGPTLGIILYKQPPKTAFVHGFFLALSDGIICDILFDFFIASFKRTFTRRILAFIIMINSLITISYGNRGIGSVLLYILTIMFCLFLMFYNDILKKPKNLILDICKKAVISIFFIYSATLLFLVIAAHFNPPVGNEKYMIVLGAGLKGYEPSTTLKYRLDKAYDYALSNPDIIIVTSGGQGADELISEGDAMKNYLVKKGLDSKRILVENMSTTTEENFKFSRNLLLQNGYKNTDSVIYVTNSFHIFRAGRYASSAGFENPSGLYSPTPYITVLPYYLREVLALYKYWLIQFIKLIS